MAHSELSKRHLKLHALAIPVPALGHINLLMRFCKRLAAQEAVSITFLDLEFVADDQALSVDQLKKKLEMDAASKPERRTCGDGHAAKPSTADVTSVLAMAAPAVDNTSQEKLDIRRVHIPVKMPKPAEGLSLSEAFFQALEILPPFFEEILSRLMIDEDLPVTCLITDLTMTRYTQKVADKFGIPRISFHTASQSQLVFMNYLLEGTIPLDRVLNVLTSKEAAAQKEAIFVEGLPGLPATLRNRDLVDDPVDNALLYEVSLQNLKISKERAHAMVGDCIQELEEPSFQVNIGSDVLVYAVGPLLDPLGNNSSSTSLWKEDKDCMLWLKEQPAHSVLYISFGSFVSVSKAQFEEIVAGLISSQQRFLWVFRPNLVRDAASPSTLHADLLSQSHGRGYVAEWAPQTMVLSHPSVGGFLTHCGWNSTMEGLFFGVPMLCFPYTFDQPWNAKLIVDEWRVGLGFEMCKESGLLERAEVEKVIRALMVEDEGKILRGNAQKIKEISRNNRLPESTSSKNIKALVDSLTS